MREFELLRHVFESNESLPPRVTIPPGDDMGAVRLKAGGEVLVTVDQVADGIHFDLANTSLEKVARKAITRNLSDVAAMAAQPIGAVVAVSLPRTFGEANAQKLFDHMRSTADAYGCPLFGGDVSMWDHPLIITVTVLAEPDGVEPVLRRGAKVGDAICVTGRLGGSLETVNGYTHHLDFEPRLALARALAGNPRLRPSSMIDLSDGLARDVSHLCDAGGVAARILIERLPASDAAHQAAARDGKTPWQHAVGDGEDYELCFTIPKPNAEAMPAQVEGVAITVIGEVVAAGSGPKVALVEADGSLLDLRGMGWEHGAS